MLTGTHKVSASKFDIKLMLLQDKPKIDLFTLMEHL
jgi:hypothetical protein